MKSSLPALCFSALSGTLLAVPSPQSDASNIVSRQSDEANSTTCSAGPDWQDTVAAWNSASTDAELQDFLTNITSGDPINFDQALGSRFGAHYPAFKCGIDLYSTCPLPACSDYQNQGDDRWAYLATVSTVHLATKFNILHTAITNGQLDYQGVIDDLADNFFKWKDPIFVGDDVAFWVVAIITMTFAALSIGGEPEAIAIAAGLGALLGTATQETSQQLMPPNGAVRSAGISYLKKTSEQIGETSRAAIEAWSNNTFAGQPDSQGNTIIDYMSGGGLLLDVSIPSAADAEKFYKSSLIAKTIDSQWKTKANFLMFASTNDPNAIHGPANSSYYSDVMGGVYNLYNLEAKQIQQPSGLQVLTDAAYGITPLQVVKSSARAWEYAGNDYNTTVAAARIQDSLSSNGTLTPFADGPAWEGMFSPPVCDVGNHIEWLTNYGGSGLPCCCGSNCKDTKAFVQAANLNTSDALYIGCQELLKNTPLKFDSIDYGITLKSSFERKWDYEWSKGQKAGIAIAFVLAGCLGVILVTVLVAGIVGCFL